MNHLVRHLCYECFSTDGSSSDALAYMALYERKICKPVGPISSPGQWKPVIRRTLMISAVQICWTQQRGRGTHLATMHRYLTLVGGGTKMRIYHGLNGYISHSLTYVIIAFLIHLLNFLAFLVNQIPILQYGSKSTQGLHENNTLLGFRVNMNKSVSTFLHSKSAQFIIAHKN